MFWLYLHCPNLQLNSLYSGCDNVPVAIVQGHKNTLSQINSAAQQAGLAVGMGLGAACAICPRLTVFPYNPESEQQKLKQLAQWLYWVTSDISLVPPNGLVLRVTPMLSLYASLNEYWQVVQCQLEQVISDYHYALAYSPQAAKLLALHQYNQINTDKNQLNIQLQQCSLDKTDLPHKTIESLNRVGVSHLADLFRLPLTELAQRFDIDLVTYIGRLKGQFKTPLEFYHPPETFKYRLLLSYELTDLNHLNKPLFKVLQLLESFLSLRAKQTDEIQLELILRDAPSERIRVGSGQGEHKAIRWLELCLLRFESVTLSAPVIEIELQALRLIDFRADSPDLFNTQTGQMSAPELVARLQAKLGESKVNGVEALSDYRPEFASRLCPPFNTCDQTLPELIQNRPSFLLNRPQPLHEQVEIIHGPERIVTGWWDHNSISRDYYIARSAAGRWLWIFRTPQQKWFVHGLYS